MIEEQAEITETAGGGAPDATLETEARAPSADQAPPSALDDASNATQSPAASKKESDEFAWPEDWRERLSGDDKTAKSVLGRLPSMDALVKKVLEQEKLIRSGKHKDREPLADDATDEQIAEYRKANGIPDEPSGYHDHLGELTIGDEDRAAIDDFMASAHTANVDPSAVKTAVDWYYKNQEVELQKQIEADQEQAAEAKAGLQERYGVDYMANMTDLKAWLGKTEGLYDTLNAARLPDGTVLGSSPMVIDFMVGLMRAENPLGTVVSGSGQAAMDNVQSEIASIEKRMQEDRDGYFKDQKMQDRYMALTEARDRVAA